jgi:hypothetical protein
VYGKTKDLDRLTLKAVALRNVGDHLAVPMTLHFRTAGFQALLFVFGATAPRGPGPPHSRGI